jgi:hypothetical protein
MSTRKEHEKTTRSSEDDKHEETRTESLLSEQHHAVNKALDETLDMKLEKRFHVIRR